MNNDDKQQPGREDEFCPMCRSWFCPHAKPNLYTDEERERYLAAIEEQLAARRAPAVEG